MGVVSLPRGSWPATCPQCNSEMDLLATPWCGCGVGHPSKICPTCDRCACDHPDYTNPICWTEAPPLLRRFGFSRLFSVYEIVGAASRERALRGA